MKTLTTTLSIFALLLSNVAFCNNSNGEITPPLRPRDPGFEINFTKTSNDITPPLRPRDPGFEIITNMKN